MECSRKYLIGFILTLFYFLLSPSFVYATEYYVSTLGSDTNPGTLIAPLKTIQSAADRVSPGDAVFVRSGNYDKFVITTSGSAGSPITFSGYESERPIIIGDDSDSEVYNYNSLLRLNASYITLRQMEFAHTRGRGVFVNFGTGSNREYITIDDVWIHHTVWAGIYMENVSHFTVKNSRIWQTCRINDPTKLWYHANMWDAAVVGRSVHGVNPDWYGDAIDMKIQNNIIYESYGEGINIHGGMDQVLIENNTIYNTFAPAIYPINSTNVLVQRNLVYHTNDSRFLRNGNPGSGIVLTDEFRPGISSNITVINNFVRGFYENFAWWFQNYKPQSGLKNVLIANNTFIDGTANIDRQLGWGNANVWIDNGSYHNNTSFQNNLIFQNDIYTGDPPVRIDYKIMQGPSNISYQSNLFSQIPLQSWVRTIGDVIGEPRLARVGSTLPGELTAEYFKLLGDSPAIDKGVVLPAVAADYFLTIRGVNPDIGAFEYVLNVEPTSSPTANPGDINGDGLVNIQDYILLSNSYGISPDHSNYNSSADLNSDNTVNIQDYQILSNNYGKSN